MNKYDVLYIALLTFAQIVLVVSYNIHNPQFCQSPSFLRISKNPINGFLQNNNNRCNNPYTCLYYQRQKQHHIISKRIHSRNRFNNHGIISMTVTNKEFVQASDLEALQSLFNKYCTEEGLMTKEMVLNVPSIAELISDDNVLPEEFDIIWNRVPKFPEVDNIERIDVDSWVQLYRDIDDLFEEDDDEIVPTGTTSSVDKLLTSVPVVSNNKKSIESEDTDFDKIALQVAFSDLCSTDTKTITKQQLFEWNEVKDLLYEGLVSQQELDGMWKRTVPKVGEKEMEIDIVGFLNFNAGLDSLFDFEEESTETETTTALQSGTTTKSKFVPRMIEDTGLEPSILFAALANPDGYVGKDELQYWGELQEMLKDGDVLPSELNNIYTLNINNENGMLDEDGFVKLYESINELFEDDDDEIESTAPKSSIKQIDDTAADDSTPEMLKKELLEAIDDITVPDKLPCGLEADDRDKKIILSIVEELEIDTNNMLRQLQRSIEPDDLTGDWELIYTSSSAMKFNKGLTGLGGSFPNGKLGRLTQKLRASKFMMDVEYIEHIQVTPATASFDVTVNGSWDLRTSVSLFTGDPSIVMTVEPNRVSYGPTSTRADHWKSLGPMNMLDITYLDDNLRIMRGNTSVETVFVFRRIS